MVAIEELTQVESISEGQLVALLSELRGSKFIGLTVDTDARLLKTNNPYGKVNKISRVSVCVNFHYDAGVLRRLEAEGKSPEDFKRGESWHEPVLTEDGKLTPFCSHKKTGELYLRVQLLQRGETKYFTQQGEELTEGDVEPWLPKDNGYANQGLDKPLVFLTYKLTSVVELTVDGTTVSVTNEGV